MTLTWQLEYFGDTQIVELKFSGRASGPDLLQAAAERIEFGRERGASKYLVNAQNMLAEKSLTLDVFEIPATVYADRQMARDSRIAVVAPSDPDSRWVTSFYEDASVNRGWLVRVFADRESAESWLQASP